MWKTMKYTTCRYQRQVPDFYGKSYNIPFQKNTTKQTIHTQRAKGRAKWCAMVLWSYPPTPGQLKVTALCFVAGASLFGVGAYLSFANIAPQQARVKARKDFVKDRIRKLLDDW